MHLGYMHASNADHILIRCNIMRYQSKSFDKSGSVTQKSHTQNSTCNDKEHSVEEFIRIKIRLTVNVFSARYSNTFDLKV